MSARMASTAPVRLSSLSKARQRLPTFYAIDVGHARVQQLRRLRSVETRLKFGFPRFERQQLLFDRDSGDAVFDSLNKLPDFTFDGRELLTTV